MTVFCVLFVVLVAFALIIVIVIVNLLLCEGELEAASELALYNLEVLPRFTVQIGQPGEYYELLTATLSEQNKVVIVYRGNSKVSEAPNLSSRE